MVYISGAQFCLCLSSMDLIPLLMPPHRTTLFDWLMGHSNQSLLKPCPPSSAPQLLLLHLRHPSLPCQHGLGGPKGHT
eukprot:1788094-Ditylum_brightwellii.AAC.2